jgi:V8-like Glu-specific endopeptidase
MIARTTIPALVLGGLLGIPDQPPPKCGDTGKIVTELGRREQVPATFAPLGGGVEAYPSPAQQNARYVRVRFTVEQVPDCDWFFTVRDPLHRPIQVFSIADFRGVATRWTHRVDGMQALFDLTPCAGGRAPVIKFVEYVWMPAIADNPYYSLQSAVPAYRDITTADTALRRHGDVVGFVASSWDRASWVCSGVILSPDLLLTNWHCGAPPGLPDKAFWNPDIQRDTLIDMSFDGDTRSRELMVTGVAVAPNKTLDFVVLRTAPIDALGPLRPVRISMTDPAANEDIRIVHHPAGKVKQISWNCVVRKASYKGWQDAATSSEFTHACDTEGGSSGAPVLNKQGELIGLHHLGFDFDKQKCQQVDKENKAVKISAILEAIERDAKAVHDEIMRWQKP